MARQDRLDRRVVGAPGRLYGSQAPEPVAVALFGQVEPGVGRVQVGLALGPVGEAAHLDPPEDDRERAGVAFLYVGAGRFFCADHLLRPLLAQCSEVEVALVEPAEDFPALLLQALFQLPVVEGGCLVAFEERHDLEEALLGRGEPGGPCAHLSPSRRARASATKRSSSP